MTKKVENVSKKAIAQKVIRTHDRRKNPLARKDLVARIAEKTGGSVALASTYLQNFRKGKWVL